MLQKKDWKGGFRTGIFTLGIFLTFHSVVEAEVDQTTETDASQCQKLTRPDWTKQEKFVWEKICRGEVANFNEGDEYGGNLPPKEPKNWLSSRILRPQFLEKILLKRKYQKAITHKGVLISGAHLNESLDLSDGTLNFPFSLVKCLIEEKVNFARLRTTSSLSFQGSRFTGTLNMNALIVASTLYMNYGAEFAEVFLINADIGGQVYMSNSRFTGTLNMNQLKVANSLFMRSGAEFSEVVLINAKIGGQVSMINSRFTSKLDMDGLQVIGHLLMRGKAEFGEVVLRAAEIGGNLEMDHSRFTNKLDMDGLQVIGHLLMREKAEFGEVNLRGAMIGRQLTMSFSSFTGPLNLSILSVGEHLLIQGSHFTRIKSIDLNSSKIEFNLDLSGSKDLPSVDLSSSTIKGELNLGQKGFPAQWQEGAVLNLRNVNVGELFGQENSWPKILELDGLVYNRLGGVAEASSEDMGRLSLAWLLTWLERQENYFHQPYRHLATVLEREGRHDKAQEILYAAKERERGEAWKIESWPQKLQQSGLMGLQKIFIGYGYRIYYSLFWILGFIGLGALILKLSGQSTIHKIPLGVFYSIDMLLPIVELRKLHYDIDLNGLVGYYFYFHKVMGYVLATYLAAGLSGLIK